jgi:hypothetical protein
MSTLRIIQFSSVLCTSLALVPAMAHLMEYPSMRITALNLGAVVSVLIAVLSPKT